MMGSVEIARKSDNPTALALPLYNLAQLHEDLKEYEDAVKIYAEAVQEMEQNPPLAHNRPAVLANMRVHMTTCEYKAGDASALDRAYSALADLGAAEDENAYNRDVWLSGAHMRIAEALRKDDPEKAREHLQKSKDIIDANPELTIRKKQWEKFAATFN
jgi:tetratricopeptide (TPR) repeat protein